MSVIEIYYYNPILECENTMLIPVSSIAKVEKLADECCVLTLNTQTEKIGVLESVADILEKIEAAIQQDKLEPQVTPPWIKDKNRLL